MTVKLLIEHHLEFLSLKRGCTGSSVSTLVKIPHCWKSHVVAHVLDFTIIDTFPVMLHTFRQMSCYVLNPSYSKARFFY